MAHKAMIGGTAYEVSGGRAMADGTVYDIAKGKALVDGTAVEIAFGGAIVTVTLSGGGNANYCYAEINGVKHTSSETIEIEAGTTITLYAHTANAASQGSIYYNNQKVAGVSTTGSKFSYSFVPQSTSVKIYMEYMGAGYGSYIEATDQ